MTRRRIMFAVSSPGGTGAAELHKVAQLAAGLEAEVELFYCIFDPGVGRPGRFGTRGAQEDIHEFVERRREQLERSADRLRAWSIPVRSSIRWDYPAHEGIVRQVLRRKPSLLVAQATRKERGERRARPQTDYRLIETCPCPILFVRNDRPYCAPLILAAVDPAHAHRKPAALDDEILRTAIGICHALAGSVRVFHACAPWQARRDVPEALRDEVRAAYCRAIEGPVRELARRHGIPAAGTRVMVGDAVELLPGIAREESAAIVALGAASRSRLGRALIGHTAERVFDAIDCDLLIARPPAFRTPVRRESTHHVPRPAALERPDAVE